MALQSMTGFSRAKGELDSLSWAWEMRSVNGKGLDLRLRVPSGFEALEISARTLLAKKFSRGNIQISLQLNKHDNPQQPTINDEALDALLQIARVLQAKSGGELPSPSELMGMRGVISYSEMRLSPEEIVVRDAVLLQSLEVAADELVAMRVTEGQSVGKVLQAQVQKISELQTLIDQNIDRTPEAINAQLKANVEKLIQTSDALDPQRLHQEAVVMAAKADLQEELDRLLVHINAASDLLKSEGPVGRKLDFLAQEFNRECNTICSKSNSADVTSLGLDMKLVIDQFREQIQNME